MDPSDGFYRLWLRPEDTPHLFVLFPSQKDEPVLVGIPLTNLMGWVSSLPNFSACTEMACDMATKDLKDADAMNLARITRHQLDVVLESRPVDELLVSSSSSVSKSVPSLASFPKKSFLKIVPKKCQIRRRKRVRQSLLKRVLKLES